MPKITDDETLDIPEMGMVRISDGLRAMDLTGESRVPTDMALFHKLDELLTEMRRTNRYLETLTNSIE